MNDVNIAFILVVVAIVLVVWFLNYKTGSSEKRMLRMVQSTGLDPEIATQGDTESIIRNVRRRCRKCQVEDLCERWLAGLEEGNNYFCPNAQVLEELKRG